MSQVLVAVIGLIAGITSGLFGVGGGVIFVPLLILIKHFDTNLAIGTSIAVIVPTAIMATFRQSLAGKVDWNTVFVLSIFAIAGAWLGADLSLRLDTVLLRRLFAVFLFGMSIKLFFQN